MDRELLDYLPAVLQQFREFREFMQAEQPEAVKMWDATDRILENTFVLSEDEATAARWEKILGLTAKDTDTLDVRNLRILSTMQEELPYTLRTLNRVLTALVGSSKEYVLTVEDDLYSVDIAVALSSKELKDEVEALAERIVPMNMLLTVRLLYTTYRMLEKLTHRKMQPYTHAELQELDLR